MKAFVFVAFALSAVSYAAVTPLVPNSVAHVVIPKDTDHVTFKWDSTSSVCHFVGHACYGVVDVYQKYTNDINPVTDKVFTTFESGRSIHKGNFSAGFYVAFYVREVTNAGPDGINGAVDLAIGYDAAGTDKIVPEFYSKTVDIQISRGSKAATLSWDLIKDDDDKTFVYRKDINTKDYKEDVDNPPEGYYQTACSAKYWMNLDEEATEAVKHQYLDDHDVGVVQVNDVTEKKTTIVAILKERKIADPFTDSFSFVTLESASSAALSVLALALLIISVLLI